MSDHTDGADSGLRMSLEHFELLIMDLEQRLRPIADRPVDISKPGWVEQLKGSPHPFDEAGVRAEAESLLEDMIVFYQTTSARGRQAARKLFQEYRAFAWAATLPSSPTTEEGFRQQLVLFSLKDQGRDYRDALLMLQDLCRRARLAGVNIVPILKQLAALSNDANKYAMASTRDMLLKACGNDPPA